MKQSLKILKKRDDGKFEVLDVKLDNRKTKSLDPNNNKVIETKKIDVVSDNSKIKTENKDTIIAAVHKKFRSTRKKIWHA